MAEFTAPEFMQDLDHEYMFKLAHVFILHGNINDYTDNSGRANSLINTLAMSNDSGYNQTYKSGDPIIRIMGYYNISQGLKFANDSMRELWCTAHEQVYSKEQINEWAEMSPNKEWWAFRSLDSFLIGMERWFEVSKVIANNNKKSKGKQPKIIFTLVITDADALLPNGDLSSLSGDRQIIVFFRNWAKDLSIGLCNRIVLVASSLNDIHESIRSEISSSHMIKFPKFQDRKEWLENISEVHDKSNNSIEFEQDFDLNQFSIQSAGMTRKQLTDVIMKSRAMKTPISLQLVKERKQKALDDQYNGVLDFKEPEFGFEQVGGYSKFKEYCNRKIIIPLKTGDKKVCSRGVLLLGPPGSGKSTLAWALAKEANMNYLTVDLGKVFGSLVGQTEQNMRKLISGIESTSPCIVFIDEIESVLSSGRTSAGDSGTSARVFNSFMTWMSDPSRTGRIVVIAATNRPDLLDSALIRSGRFDAKIALLPPDKGDAAGRKEIIAALIKKNQFKLHKDLKDTEQITTNGLGRLLWDSERIWTGAEMEVVLKEAYDQAFYNSHQNSKGDYVIHVEDFNIAMDNIIPNTAEVEKQSLLGLLFTDNLLYVEDAWKERAKDKEALRQQLGLTD